MLPGSVAGNQLRRRRLGRPPAMTRPSSRVGICCIVRRLRAHPRRRRASVARRVCATGRRSGSSRWCLARHARAAPSAAQRAAHCWRGGLPGRRRPPPPRARPGTTHRDKIRDARRRAPRRARPRRTADADAAADFFVVSVRIFARPRPAPPRTPHPPNTHSQGGGGGRRAADPSPKTRLRPRHPHQRRRGKRTAPSRDARRRQRRRPRRHRRRPPATHRRPPWPAGGRAHPPGPDGGRRARATATRGGRVRATAEAGGCGRVVPPAARHPPRPAAARRASTRSAAPAAGGASQTPSRPTPPRPARPRGRRRACTPPRAPARSPPAPRLPSACMPIRRRRPAGCAAYIYPPRPGVGERLGHPPTVVCCRPSGRHRRGRPSRCSTAPPSPPPVRGAVTRGAGRGQRRCLSMLLARSLMLLPPPLSSLLVPTWTVAAAVHATAVPAWTLPPRVVPPPITMVGIVCRRATKLLVCCSLLRFLLTCASCFPPLPVRDGLVCPSRLSAAVSQTPSPPLAPLSPRGVPALYSCALAWRGRPRRAPRGIRARGVARGERGRPRARSPSRPTGSRRRCPAATLH